VRTAYATLATGTLSYLVGQAAGLTAPFLLSLATALGTYVVGALLGRARGAGARAGAPA
jgi:hypothetical protein